jgi:hypothetical protein
MSLNDEVRAFRDEFEEFEQSTGLASSDIGELIEPVLQGEDLEVDGLELDSQQQSTLFRLVWWLSVWRDNAPEDSAALLSDSQVDFDAVFDQLEQLADHQLGSEQAQILAEEAKQVKKQEGGALQMMVTNAVEPRESPQLQDEELERLLMHLHQYLPNLLDGIENTVDAYQKGKLREADDVLPLLAEGIEWTTKTLLGIESSLDEAGIDIDREELLSKLRDFNTALQAKDWIYIRDLLDNELYPEFYRYRGLIEDLLLRSSAESLLDENLKALAEFNPQAAESVEKATLGTTDVQMEQAEDGARSLRVTTDSGAYFICGPYNPRMAADEWAELQVEKKKYPVVVVFGFGMGYRLRALIEKLPEDYSLLVVEPNPAQLKEVMDVVDCRDLFNDPRLRLVTGDKLDTFGDVFEDLVNWRNVTQTTQVELPNYRQLYTDLYLEFLDAMQRHVSIKRVLKRTHYQQGLIWLRNTIENIPTMFEARSLTTLRDAFEGKPVVVVSAGPSLDKNMDLLKDVRDNVVIVAVDTAVKALKERGIEPHLMVTVDGKNRNYRLNLKPSPFEDVPLVGMLRSYPPIYEESRARKFLLSDGVDARVLNKSLLGEADINWEHTTFGVGSSVAHMAYNVARFVGGSPIIFIGQDLAYSEENRYASGIQEDEEYSFEEEAEYTAEGIDGEPVPTNETWYTFLRQFQEIIDEDEHVIDATEGGLKIKNTEIRTLQETLDEYCQEPFYPDQTIEEVWEQTTSIDPAKVPKLFDQIDSIKKSFDDFEEEFEEALELCDELSKIYDKDTDELSKRDRSRAEEILEKLDEVEQKFKDEDEMSLLHLATSPITDATKNMFEDLHLRGEGVEQPKVIADISSSMYESLINVFNHAHGWLEDVEEDLEDQIESEG